MKKFLILAVVGMAFIGCSNNVVEIPAGFVGKVKTPTGWEGNIREASQVDIGITNSDGTSKSMVLLEATSVTIKEQFMASDPEDKTDHRVIIGKAPVAVDFYIRAMIPEDETKRNAVFAQITPQATTQARVSAITIDMVYKQFAKMDVRSGVRAILSKYTDVNYIITHLDTINVEVASFVLKTFKNNNVPLLMQNAQISNVKVDEMVWAAENQKQAALAQVEAINKIGAALRANPEYQLFKKYDTYEAIAKLQKEVSFTIIDGQPGGIVINK